MYRKIACNIFSGYYGARLQVIWPFFKFSNFLTHKVPLILSFEFRKSLTIMPSLAYTEMNQKKTPLDINVCIGYEFWTFLHISTCI